MKNFFLLFLPSLLLSNLVYTQSKKSIRVKAGDDVAKAYSPNGFYRFPRFSKATIFYKGVGQNTGELLNYNILSGTMQFINATGKIFNMNSPPKVDSIVFEKDVFIYNEGFLERVIQTGPVTLLKKIIIKSRVEKIGALGLPSQSSPIDNISIYSADTDVYNLVINSDVVIVETVYWYWMGSNNNIVKATKENFLKLLPPETQRFAETYTREHKTNFENENDLKELITSVAANN